MKERLRFAQAALAIAVVLTGGARVEAVDCQALIRSFFGGSSDPDPSYGTSILVTMVSLNGLNTAAYTESRLYYETPERVPCIEPNFVPPRTALQKFIDSMFGRKPEARCIPRYMRLPTGELEHDAAKFDFGYRVQVFSDRTKPADPPLLPPANPDGLRLLGLPHRGVQKFDEAQSDSIDFEMTDSQPVLVTMTLRSWGNGKITLTPSCYPNGFMLGAAGGAWYIFRLQRFGSELG